MFLSNVLDLLTIDCFLYNLCLDLNENSLWRRYKMKKWNAPAIAELNIEETANGFVDFYFEGDHEWLFNNKKAEVTPETDVEIDTVS